MNTDTADQTEESPAPPDALKETRVEHIAVLIADMNRFLSNFGQNPAFKDAKISLAEWLVLTMVAQKVADNPKDLTKTLGLAPPRLKQILELLTGAGLVEISGDSLQGTVAISEQGQRTIETMSAALQPRIDESFRGRERSIIAFERGLKVLLRVAASAPMR